MTHGFKYRRDALERVIVSMLPQLSEDELDEVDVALMRVLRRRDPIERGLDELRMAPAVKLDDYAEAFGDRLYRDLGGEA